MPADRLAVRLVVAVAVLAAGCGQAVAGDERAADTRANGGQFGVLQSSELLLVEPDREPTGSDPVADGADGPEETPPATTADGDPPDSAADTTETDRIEGPSDTPPPADPAGTIVAHVVTETIVAYTEPRRTADEVERFTNPTEYDGPLVFQALSPPADGWLEVLLPIRPNGTAGWIPADEVELTINPYRIEIDASAYELTVYRNDKPALTTTVAIGTGNTPTPLGRFYLVALLRPRNQDGPYGSYAYGLSGHSETLDSFNGGDGGIGIHGTNRPDLLGQDVSHGCIRVANPTIEEMAAFLPLGTPVHIFRSADDTA
ncbi:MAG: L,D-transpeptidase [Actinomycetota bacterium]